MKKTFLFFLFLFTTSIFAQEWEVIDSTVVTSFTCSNPNDVAIGMHSEIWLGNNCHNDPLALYHHGAVSIFDSVDYQIIPGNVSRYLTVDNNNNLWFEAEGSTPFGSFPHDDWGVVKYDGEYFSVYDTENADFAQDNISSISVDGQNNIWFTDNMNIIKFDGSTWERTDYRDSFAQHVSFGKIKFDNEGNKWISAYDDGVYVLNTDDTWTIYDTTNTDLKSQNISEIEFDNSGHVWIATYWGGVARADMDMSNLTIWDTTNSGIAAGGDFNTARAVKVDKNGTVWVGHETGVASFNGSDWTYYNSSNSPLPEYDGTTQLVEKIEVDEYNNKYFVTLFGGVYIFNEDGVSNVEQTDEVPSSFALHQNYPNPFNPSTTINFSIPKQSNVSLRVYDALGREVVELVNEEMSSGSYKVDFDATNLSSGVYFYTLKTNNSVLTRKMMLIR